MFTLSDVFQTLMEGKGDKGDKADAEGAELLRKEVERLKEELKTSAEGQYPRPRVHAHTHQVYVQGRTELKRAPGDSRWFSFVKKECKTLCASRCLLNS